MEMTEEDWQQLLQEDRAYEAFLVQHEIKDYIEQQELDHISEEISWQ